MTNNLKNALEKAGFQETPKPKKERYKILHIPTASYLMKLDWTTQKIKEVSVIGKAKAGHIRDSYRFGKMLEDLYFFPEVLDQIQTKVKSKYVLFYQLRTNIESRRADLQKNPMGVNEFEFIKIE